MYWLCSTPIINVLASIMTTEDNSKLFYNSICLALYGVIFPGKESSAGFSNYRLWESAGFIFAYILQTQVINLKKFLKKM